MLMLIVCMYITRVTVTMLSNASVHTLLIMTVDGVCTIYYQVYIRYQGTLFYLGRPLAQRATILGTLKLLVT